MKKRIYLVRHAQAESQAPMFRDFERELTSSGYIEAARMAAFLNGTPTIALGRMVASSAFRTKQTAQVFAEQLHFEWSKVELIDDLYDCGPRAYIRTVTDTPETIEQLLVVGHNPDISYFTDYLTHSFEGSMEKASVCIIEFKDLRWAEICDRSGQLLAYHTARELAR